MNKIDQLKKFWAMGGCSLKIVDAPKDAYTFDKMLVITVDETKTIRRVSLYNSTEDKVIGDY